MPVVRDRGWKMAHDRLASARRWYARLTGGVRATPTPVRGPGRCFGLAAMLAVLPAMLTVEPVSATTAASRPPAPRSRPVSSPPLELPAPSIPAGDGALAVPDDWDAPAGSARSRRAMSGSARRGREVVA